MQGGWSYALLCHRYLQMVNVSCQRSQLLHSLFCFSPNILGPFSSAFPYSELEHQIFLFQILQFYKFLIVIYSPVSLMLPCITSLHLNIYTLSEFLVELEAGRLDLSCLWTVMPSIPADGECIGECILSTFSAITFSSVFPQIYSHHVSSMVKFMLLHHIPPSLYFVYVLDSAGCMEGGLMDCYINITPWDNMLCRW